MVSKDSPLITELRLLVMAHGVLFLGRSVNARTFIVITREEEKLVFESQDIHIIDDMMNRYIERLKEDAKSESIEAAVVSDKQSIPTKEMEIKSSLPKE